MNKKYIWIIALIVFLAIAIVFVGEKKETVPAENKLDNLIIVESPLAGGEILSPLKFSGQARGSWFFEGDFPVVLTNWDGLIIAQGIATAQGEWMTEEFVPFTGELIFNSPVIDGADYTKRGSLIFQKDNPSGLPENDKALEFGIFFK